MNHGTIAGTIRRIAMLGNHLPRQCGIATFTTDLSGAIAAEFSNADCFVLAMNDAGRQSRVSAAGPLRDRRERYRVVPPRRGFFERQQGRRRVRAARVRHLRRQGRQPPAHAPARTAHADRDDPSHHPRRAEFHAARAMNEIARLSERLVVMSAHGAALLHNVHGVPEHKIDIIPHGIPSVPFAAAARNSSGSKASR